MISRRLQLMLVLGSGFGIAASCTATDAAQSATIETRPSAHTAAIARSSVAGTRYVVGPAGNEVRYRVREQLVGFDLPNDAVGTSANVSGAIVIDDAGHVVPAESHFVVDAATFTSDRDRRDGYVRGRVLEAAQYPSVMFVPSSVRGISLPPATPGTYTFDLLGDLTVRGVTRPTTWRVTAKVADGQVTGSAVTRFAFTEFAMEKPRVRSVLSVADTIALEYDFALVREGAGTP